MTPRRSERQNFVGAVLAAHRASCAFEHNEFRSNLLLDHSPTGVVKLERPFRNGGTVIEGSDERSGEDLAVRFALPDTAESVPVSFGGILPNIFREDRGIVATGRHGPDGTFVAEEVLAEHDKDFVLPEMAEALEPAGQMFSILVIFVTTTVVDP